MIYRTGVCNFCGTGCGHLLKVADGAVRGVFASPGHPVSRGRLCVRGWHIHELLATGDRVAAPLVRKDGRLEPVSYGEGVALAAGRLSRFSGDEVAFLASPRASNEDNFLMARLARETFRTPNIALASDQGHAAAVEVLHAGTGMAAMTGALTEVRKAGLILVVGADITKLNPIIGSELHLAARGGAELVTLSSRRTQIAGLGRTHLWLKPGSKRTALAAVAKVMIKQGWQDKDFVRSRTEGFEAFSRSLDGLDLDGVEAATGLAPAEIEGLARRLSEARSAMAFFSSGISGLDRETVAMIYDLFLLSGKVGREGCGVNPVAGVANIVGSYDVGAALGHLPGPRPVAGPEAGRSPDELLADAGSPLRALVVADHDEELIRHADRIRTLECVVYVGAYGNPFMDLAHVVLPSATYAEADGTFTNTERRIQLNRAKVEPPPGVLPAWRVYADIAAAAGKGAVRAHASAEEVMKDIAATVPSYSGVTYAGLEKGFGLQWPVDAARPGGTPRLALEDLPGRLRFVPIAGGYSGPTVSEAFPVRLTAGKANYFWHQNVIMKKTHIPKREYNALLLLYPKGFVEIAAEDAARLGVRDRGAVAVVSEKGSMRVAARVTTDVRPGTAHVPYFVGDMVPGFLDAHVADVARGEDAVIPVRIEKV